MYYSGMDGGCEGDELEAVMLVDTSVQKKIYALYQFS